MRSLDHPNMLRIHHFYEDDAEYFYMVLDFMAGGMLFDRVVQKVGMSSFDSASSYNIPFLLKTTD